MTTTALLYEHDDGRYAVSPGPDAAAFSHGDPGWHRLGPVDVSALAVSDMRDAYAGAREDLGIWKRRALEAEELVRKFAREVNGPAHMGEPAAQPVAAEPVAVITVEDSLRTMLRWEKERVIALEDELREMRSRLPGAAERDAAFMDLIHTKSHHPR